MGSCGSPIKLNDDIPFIKSEWIGQSKKFTNVPDFVRLQAALKLSRKRGRLGATYY